MPDDTREIRLDCDERYPFFRQVGAPRGYPLTVSAETEDRWRRVMQDFETVQDEMQAEHRAAHRRETERDRLEKAEQEARAAQDKLERLRWEQDHPLYLAETWPTPDSDECAGLDYGDDKAALAERLRIHNTWGEITFDLIPYWCANGHCHLRRRA